MKVLAAILGALIVLIQYPLWVGKGGWVGMRLDRGAKWAQVAEIIEQAHAARRAKPR